MTVDQYIEKASDDAKKMYMQRIWAMDKEQVFHELMRVHAESSKLLMQAQAELDHLRSLVGEDDSQERHWEADRRTPNVQNRNAQSHILSNQATKDKVSRGMEKELFPNDLCGVD